MQAPIRSDTINGVAHGPHIVSDQTEPQHHQNLEKPAASGPNLSPGAAEECPPDHAEEGVHDHPQRHIPASPGRGSFQLPTPARQAGKPPFSGIEPSLSTREPLPKMLPPTSLLLQGLHLRWPLRASPPTMAYGCGRDDHQPEPPHVAVPTQKAQKPSGQKDLVVQDLHKSNGYF